MRPAYLISTSRLMRAGWKLDSGNPGRKNVRKKDSHKIPYREKKLGMGELSIAMRGTPS